MDFFRQLRLLLWKNFTLLKRQPIRIVVEIVWPLILFLILMWVKLDNVDLKVMVPECHFDSKAMPSSGFIPFVQSLFCTSNNTCHETMTSSEQRNLNDYFNRSLASDVITQTVSLLDDPEVIHGLSSLLDDVTTLVELLKKAQASGTPCLISMNSLIEDSSAFKKRVNFTHSYYASDADFASAILDSSVNVTEILALLGEAPNDPMTTLLSGTLCGYVAGDEHTLNRRLLVLSDIKAQQRFDAQLCNLTAAQLQLFGSTIAKDISPSTVGLQVTNCMRKQLGVWDTLILMKTVTSLGINMAVLGPVGESLTSLLKRAGEVLNISRLVEQHTTSSAVIGKDFNVSTTTDLNFTQWISLASSLLCNTAENNLVPTEESFIARSADQVKTDGRVNRLNSTDSSDSDSSVYDNTTTEFCKELYKKFDDNESPQIRIMWRQIKPFIVGRIPFSPDTPTVRRIIKQANGTFEILAEIEMLIERWINSTPAVYEYFSSNQNLNGVRRLIEMLSFLQPSSRMLASVEQFLYSGPKSGNTSMDWRDALNISKSIAETILEYMQCVKLDKFEPFKSEAALINISLTYIENQTLWAALVFNVSNETGITANGSRFPTFVSYKIRMDSDRVDSTQSFKVVDRYWTPGARRRPLPDMKYIVYGFAYLQDMIEHGILNEWTEGEQYSSTWPGVGSDIGIVVQQFPYPCYINDRFTLAISRTMPMFMVLAWIFTVAMIVKGIVYEKELRLKEAMKVMGLGNAVHWMAWFITSAVMMILSILLLITVLKGGNVLERTDSTILFVFMLSFTLATISQCFMISVFFARANLASACAAIFYFIGYLPYPLCVQWEEYMENWQKMLASMSSTVAFGFGCSYIARYEQQAVGSQWYNIGTSPIPEDNFSLLHCIIIMLVDSILYFLITWYIEAVFPGEFGVPKRWYFFITPSYWCGSSRCCTDHNTYDIAAASVANDIREVHDSNLAPDQVAENFEKDPIHLPLGVSLKGLTKVYANGNKMAINNLSLNFYEGQITSFLGHNGAGKTTTMFVPAHTGEDPLLIGCCRSILTGLFPPTAGTALVYGKDIRYEMDEIHQNMGMCPQHNVLFDNMTVEEHLKFYARLKGINESDLALEVEGMIADVGLPHKRAALAKDLSGGMKRKLSIAVAFTAGSRIVILDEPTAGVDPYARRSIWELLLKYKTGRTILLSTHFMDEADILGDRIAVISEGELRCCGSSMFLKRRFGSGYYLTLVLSGSQRNELQYGTDTADAMQISQRDNEAVEAAVSSLIGRHISGAVLSERLSSELTYQLPDDKESVKKFDKLFTELDSRLAELHVSGYGISNTTLEEVFLKVDRISSVREDAEGGGWDQMSGEQKNGHTDDTTMNGNLHVPTDSDPAADDGVSHAVPGRRNILRRARRTIVGWMRRKRPVTIDDNIDDTEALLLNAHYGAQGPPVAPSTTMNHAAGRTMSDGEETVIGHETSPEDCAGHGRTNGTLHPVLKKRVHSTVGAALIRRQFVSLFLKRFNYVRRSKKSFIAQFLLPAVFICMAMVFSMLNPSVPEQPAMEIHPWLLAPVKMSDSHLYVFYSRNDETKSDWTNEIIDQLTNKQRPGLGTRCMDPTIHSIHGFPCVEKEQSGWTPASKADNLSMSCSCKTGYQECPDGAGGPEPSRMSLMTHDYLYNMTERNISDWLVKTNTKYLRKRYGGLTFDSVDANLSDLSNYTISSDLANMVSKLALTANQLLGLNLTSLFWTDSNQSSTSLTTALNKIVVKSFTIDKIKVWFDNTGYSAMVAYVNAANNAILRRSIGPAVDRTKYGITLINHPMNRTKQQLAQYAIRASGADALIAISVIFAMSQIPASFVVFLIEERQSGSKHLQFVSGVNPIIYWLVNFTWDMLNYAVSATLCILLFLAFQQHEYVSGGNLPCLILLLFLYGWAVTPLMYPVSYMFKVSSTAFVAMGCLNIFLGLLCTLSTFILELFMEPRLDRINDILKKVFLIFPHFCLGRGLIDMTRNQLIADVFAGFGEDLFKNPLGWDIVGKNLFSLFFLGIFFFALTICIEFKFWTHKLLRKDQQQPQQSTAHSSTITYVTDQTGDKADEDEDVRAERIRIASGTTDMLTIKELTKSYETSILPRSFHHLRESARCCCRKKKSHHLAVDHISVGVQYGECFGLLGVNGAGKTTTFKMLTGDVRVTSGDAHLAGHSILSEMGMVRQKLGYCPQFDALCTLLTVKEHLQMYARLRGILEQDINDVVREAMSHLSLTRYADKCSADLSGGNRRKLSTAIALIGDPKVVFLDEPTTGMDPNARRFLWNRISDIVKDGRSVILTSHSMEECEALCSRLAIMVNGRFQCIGSTQHLKNRFGEGYTVVIRVAAPSTLKTTSRLAMTNGFSTPPSHLQATNSAGGDITSRLESIISFIEQIFPGSQLKEQHHNMLSYQLTASGDSAPLSKIFGVLESVREQFHIEDYSVSQTTLDQVFISFAKLQMDIDNDSVLLNSTNEM